MPRQYEKITSSSPPRNDEISSLRALAKQSILQAVVEGSTPANY